MASRTRTKGSIVALYGQSRSCTYQNPLPTVVCGAFGATSTGDLVGNGETVETRDEVHPMFKRLSREGHIFNGPFETTKVLKAWSLGNRCTATLKVPPGTPAVNLIQKSEWDGKLISYMNAARCAGLAPSFDTSTAVTLAGTSAMAAIENPEVQGLVDLAELGKTLKMLKTNTVGFANFLRKKQSQLRKGLGREPTKKEWLDFASGKWLEWRYGWTPLFGTIRGLQAALAKERKSTRKTARGSAFRPPQGKDDIRVSNVASGGNGWNYTSDLKLRVTGTVKAGVLYYSYFALRNDLGISLRELPSTAWELVPYSFVADWFFNFGEFLRASTPRAGITILSEWTTVTKVETYAGTNTVTPVNTTGATYTYSGGGTTLSGTTVISSKIRTPGVEVGLVSRVQEIVFEKPKDWIHLIDAIALAYGAITGSNLSTVRK